MSKARGTPRTTSALYLVSHPVRGSSSKNDGDLRSKGVRFLMQATASDDEMAETLFVLSGFNADNAACHFFERSQDLGDVASAATWSRILRAVKDRFKKPPINSPPVPLRLRREWESAIFAAAQYEYVSLTSLDLGGIRTDSEIGGDVEPFKASSAPESANNAPRILLVAVGRQRKARTSRIPSPQNIDEPAMDGDPKHIVQARISAQSEEPARLCA